MGEKHKFPPSLGNVPAAPDPNGEDEITRQLRERNNQRIEAEKAKRKRLERERKRPN